jgi:transcriptional regulator with XRE-family HTH domain
MGRVPREKPARLAVKLVHIRNALGLSQDEMVRRLDLTDQLTREEVSKYERGLRVPSLLTLLRYARLSNMIVDDLIDDHLVPPDKLPSTVKKERIRHRSSGKANSKD